MALRNHSICTNTGGLRRGITLIEIIIAMSILALLAVGGLSFSFQALHHQTANQQLLLLTSLLQEARQASLAHADSLPHGVRIEQEHFVSFVGHEFSSRLVSRDILIPVEPSITKSGVLDIIFLEGSADAVEYGAVTLLTANYERAIRITPAGGIIIK